jgi:fungal STAND N-terminal Goodbye domain
MSSISTSSSRTSYYNFKEILDRALNDYTQQTGVKLSKYDFVKQLDLCNSTEHVLALFSDKARQFKEFREKHSKLINWITPIVQIVHLLSGFLGESLSAVSCHVDDPSADVC